MSTPVRALMDWAVWKSSDVFPRERMPDGTLTLQEDDVQMCPYPGPRLSVQLHTGNMSSGYSYEYSDLDRAVSELARESSGVMLPDGVLIDPTRFVSIARWFLERVTLPPEMGPDPDEAGDDGDDFDL